MSKAILKLFLALTLIFSVTTPALAKSDNKNITTYLWDEKTKEISDIPTNADSLIVNDTSDLDINPSLDTNIGPLWIYGQLVRYDQSTASINYTKKYVGQTRVDNSGNKYTTAKLIYKATSSGTWTVEANTSLETQAELNLIVSKVNATVTIGGSTSRSWTSGYEYGTETDVPPGKIGTITAYIPGTSSLGQAVYKMVNDSTGEWWYEYRSRGAVVPASNSWNFVVKIN